MQVIACTFLIGVIMVQLIGGGSDLTSTQSQMNQNLLEIKGREVTEFFKDDTGTRRVMLGKGKDGFYGLKVSQEGSDVYDATNDQLVFNSDNNVFKIVDSQLVEVSASGDTSFNHGLSYTPSIVAYLDYDGTGSNLWPLPFIQQSGGSITVLITVRVTPSAVILNSNQTLSTPASIRYYLLQETAN